MKLLDLLTISDENQKGFSPFREYLRLNKAIHYFVHCIHKQDDEIEVLTNESYFKLARLIATLIFLKDCIEMQDVAEIRSVQTFCDSMRSITNFEDMVQLLNYVLKKEVTYIDDKLMSSIEKVIIKSVKDKMVGAHYDSANNEFTFDDISCNTSDSQHLFDKIGTIYQYYCTYNFSKDIPPNFTAES